MKIEADVKNISKLSDYYFLVPDYQREYVWKVDDQVEQFIMDLDNEYQPEQKDQNGYFLGSVISRLIEGQTNYSFSKKNG
ncbi:GmrSD restriction endonuclease domain-containing protein [Escherichia coli]|uniref:GmrSD restriction endonuclease domain-containing protein n=1 Tax=Escherichia coli TaxID=562 RepID=UPI002037270F|nr:DUF262 domain-containing protein [Escherichia coli]